MNSEGRQPARDEAILIDFLLGKCNRADSEEVARRLESDPAFRQLHDDLDRTFAALGAAPEPAAPDDLTERTLAAIAANRPRQAPQLSRRSSMPTFSLRELGAVAAAVILLAGVFIPSMQAAKNKRLRRECGYNLGQVDVALRQYAQANRGALPGVEGAQRRWMPSGGAPAVSTSAGLFVLVKNQGVAAEVFVCPATRGKPSPYVIRPTMTDFPSADHISYSYQYSLDGRALSVSAPGVSEMADEMAILGDSNPVFVDGQFRPDRIGSSSDNHRRAGQNVLYLSGRVAWQKTPDVGVGGNNIYLIDGVDDYQGVETPTDDADSFLLPAYTRTGR